IHRKPVQETLPLIRPRAAADCVDTQTLRGTVGMIVSTSPSTGFTTPAPKSLNTRTIYLDHAATTPLDPRVLEAMLPYLTQHQANPSSVPGPGRRARFAIESAREEVAPLLGAEPGEIIFTSGGTEADNAALSGVARATSMPLITSRAEHAAVLRTAERLQATGTDVTF